MKENEIIEILDDIWTFGQEPTEKERLAASRAIVLIQELQKYCAIGTVEECRAAMEMRRAIKPTFEMNYGDFESLFSCECGKKIIVRHNRGIMDNHNGPNYCSNCGKKWDWSDSP